MTSANGGKFGIVGVYSELVHVHASFKWLSAPKSKKSFTMLIGRKRTASAFGTDGKRLKPHTCHQNRNEARQRSGLFASGNPILVKRAPIIPGLSIPVGLTKKFKRPVMKRRAYSRNAEEALRKSSLGARKRMDGMSKLLARAGRGLTFKLPSSAETESTASDTDDGEEENDEVDERPFEPLLVWQSPHNGGELSGIEPVQ